MTKRKERLDHEEEKLRSEPGDGIVMPANPFETSVGHFWGIHGTRNYMRARIDYIDAMKHISTYNSVQTQVEHARDMLRLCRGDNMGTRDWVPSLLLRLGRDQECYDFIKWWCITADHLDWTEPGIVHPDIRGANAFEPVTDFAHEDSELSMISALALLKIRLLLDLLALQNSTGVPSLQELPRETFNSIRSHVPRNSIVSQNRALQERQSVTAEIRELESQAHQLYGYVNDSNPSFWSLLL
ncbi:hypothetical protein PHISP_04237 [Aspergillus sp. HF37]|nr:hypothetical protein PHISP_04237 [Aspergillus sp. HF37]